MTRYILHRLAGTIPVLLLISLLVFSLIHAAPGDPTLLLLGEETTAEDIARAKERWGLDQPFWVRYGLWLANMLQGNLGDSYFSRQSVVQLVGGALPVTLELTVLALVVALVIAIPAGIIIPVSINRSTRPRFRADQAVPRRRGTTSTSGLPPLAVIRRPSIQPKQSASSTMTSSGSTGRPPAVVHRASQTPLLLR